MCNCALCLHVDERASYIDPSLAMIFVRFCYMLHEQIIGPSTMFICD